MRQSTGLDNAALSEEIYQYFGRPEAWIVAPGAKQALARLRDAGEDQEQCQSCCSSVIVYS